MTLERRSPGRPRDAAVERGLLEATQDLLGEVGFERTSIDAVAARVGASKSSVYRRWPTKTDLVVAAVRDCYQAPPVPDLGSLRADLLAAGRAYTRGDERARRLLSGLITEMGRNEELRTAAQESLGAPYLALFTTVLSRGVERGLVRPDADLDLVASILPALAFHRVAVQGGHVDEELVARVVDGVLLPLVAPDAQPGG